MASIHPLRNRRTRHESPPAPNPVEDDANTTADPAWLVRPVIRLLAEGGERAATQKEIDEISQSIQPANVRIEEAEDGTRRTLIYEPVDYTQGEMFGESNESLGPPFTVADNAAARRGFDDLTRDALRRSGADLES